MNKFVLVDNSSNFSNPEYSNTSPILTGTTDTAITIPNGTYYWRVRAENFINEFGPYSAARVLKIVP